MCNIIIGKVSVYEYSMQLTYDYGLLLCNLPQYSERGN